MARGSVGSDIRYQQMALVAGALVGALGLAVLEHFLMTTTSHDLDTLVTGTSLFLALAGAIPRIEDRLIDGFGTKRQLRVDYMGRSSRSVVSARHGLTLGLMVVSKPQSLCIFVLLLSAGLIHSFWISFGALAAYAAARTAVSLWRASRLPLSCQVIAVRQRPITRYTALLAPLVVIQIGLAH